ncbi:MAG: mannonate dehydratase [Candidatus Bathyarchaeia archaeon]|nr:mannonate dehydratase [Candidatus Bathyarchaeota archaeon]
MRLALGSIYELTEDKLIFAKQLGVEEIVVHAPVDPSLSGGPGYYEFYPLLRLRTRVEAYGLKLLAIENIPSQWYMKVMLGEEGRDEQIENFCKTLENMGKARIPILGYNFMPTGVWRTCTDMPWRGARVTSFDYELVKDAPAKLGKLNDEQMWENFKYFIKRVLPTAEEAGVKLALHPDDPPVPSIAGIARIFRSVEAFKRLIEMAPSEYNGILFCQGNFALMETDIMEAIRYFGSRRKIFYVHFRNVRGNAYKFHETFIDDGQVDMLRAMLAYKEVGYDSVFIDDHVPHSPDDTPWCHRGRAYACGYIKALIEAVKRLG